MSNLLYVQTGLNKIVVVDQNNARAEALLTRLGQILNEETATVRKHLTLSQLGEIETIYSALEDEGTLYTPEVLFPRPMPNDDFELMTDAELCERRY